MRQENKPCSFCGSDALTVTYFDGGFHVYCVKCIATGPEVRTSRDEAWEKWNNQKELAEKDAIINWLADNARARWCAVPDGEKCRYPSKPTIGEHCIRCWREIAREEVK